MMHLTVPQSRQELDTHIYQYSAFYNDWETVINHKENDLDSNNNGNTESVQTLTDTPTTPQQRQLDLQKIKKPKANTISTKQIQETSFSRSTAKRRERRLKKRNNQHIRLIHKELADNSLEGARSLEDVEKAQEYRREVRDQLRSFELTPSLLEPILSPLQGTEATKATATVHVTDGWCNGECGVHHLAEMTDHSLSYEGVTCPKTRQKVIPIMLVGTGALRGFSLARAHKLVDGSVKTVRVHGAVECVNRDCEAAQCGYTIRGRDDNAAVAIAIAGYSNLTSRDTLKTGERRTLPPFEPRLRPRIATPKPSAVTQLEYTKIPKASAMGPRLRLPDAPKDRVCDELLVSELLWNYYP
ncbi:hypothetical protein BGZ97_007464 [Linnemannia gamsii]|uniref:Uncharacterized protein n=1 Tax=Linnemannia gamsii TaxID=64522 RepID=A0A9P6RES9_9FUNG|nr:hypothetical protein BGZ97_007464 [Linnemannia gamsii]